ncbi:MAG: MAPEG family protein [Pseudomonadota bacterium]
MTMELIYLTLTAGLCLVLWLPYIAADAMKGGLPTPEEYRTTAGRERVDWARRAHRAHLNLVENLPIFAVLVLVAHVAGISSDLVTTSIAVFFWARVAYTIIYLLGVPYLRTLAFAIGTFAQIGILIGILQ